MPRQPKRRRISAEPSSPWLRACVVVLSLPVSALFKLRWRAAERLPAAGPAILVINHVSYADPLVIARYLYDAGRAPRFLAKRGLFTVPLVGAALRGTGQIPVDRGTVEARQSLADAVAALRRGETILIYPEGTVTRDPEWWPMTGRTGAARLALLAPDVPVIPMAQWGAQFAVDVYHKRYRPWPRKVATVTTGAPVDLARFRGAEASTATLREMTEVMTQAISELLGDLRGAEPPAGERYRYRPGRSAGDAA